MIPINPVDDAHALLVIAALNAVLQTGFIGGERDGYGDGDGYGAVGDAPGNGSNNSVTPPAGWLLS